MKGNKLKDIHLRVPIDLYNKIEKERGDLSKNEVYTDLLIKGVQIAHIENIEEIIKSINIKTNYTKLLLEQIYADLDFERKDVSKSKNLIEFKEQFTKKSKYYL